MYKCRGEVGSTNSQIEVMKREMRKSKQCACGCCRTLIALLLHSTYCQPGADTCMLLQGIGEHPAGAGAERLQYPQLVLVGAEAVLHEVMPAWLLC